MHRAAPILAALPGGTLLTRNPVTCLRSRSKWMVIEYVLKAAGPLFVVMLCYDEAMTMPVISFTHNGEAMYLLFVHDWQQVSEVLYHRADSAQYDMNDVSMVSARLPYKQVLA
ncbi:hypothetical protein E4U39_000851 [Claviceps sp. Clav50 group G5]|nr:hypothetical protein E4U39_000851 [Claviceps sp. Clav50 group G5]